MNCNTCPYFDECIHADWELCDPPSGAQSKVIYLDEVRRKRESEAVSIPEKFWNITDRFLSRYWKWIYGFALLYILAQLIRWNLSGW